MCRRLNVTHPTFLGLAPGPRGIARAPFNTRAPVVEVATLVHRMVAQRLWPRSIRWTLSHTDVEPGLSVAEVCENSILIAEKAFCTATVGIAISDSNGTLWTRIAATVLFYKAGGAWVYLRAQ